jgi:predicted DNA-binding protein
LPSAPVAPKHTTPAKLLKHLDDLEDIYFAEKALADIRSGKSKLIPIKK